MTAQAVSAGAPFEASDSEGFLSFPSIICLVIIMDSLFKKSKSIFEIHHSHFFVSWVLGFWGFGVLVS